MKNGNLKYRNGSLLIFDFDGVIADSFDAALKVTQFLSPETTREEYTARFNGNINETTPVANNSHQLDFFFHWEPLVIQQRVFAGISEIISELAQRVPLAIVSSTTTQPIKDFLRTHKLHNCFSHILGNDVAHSKVTKINMLFKQTKTKPAASIMITDTLGDLKEAHQTGIHTIAVTWGFHDQITLLQGNPTTIIDHPHQLPPQIDKILQPQHSQQHSSNR
jgi:phosphoglycolate phosphatase